MDKLSIVIDPKEWGNLITKYEPHSPTLTSADFTDGTINLDTDTNGSLSKRKGGPNYNTALLPAAPKDQFEAIFSDGARHLLVVSNGEIRYSSGDTVFNSVVNGTGFSAGANFEFATTQDRVYGDNGISAAQVYDRAANYGGVTYTVPRLKIMGAQVPVSAPSVAVAAGGAVPVGGHTYKITFLYYDAEESNGGPASAVATTTAGNQTVNLTAIPVGGYGVTARNIYRDNNDGNWVFLHQLGDNTSTTYSDTLLSSATPTPIPTDNGTPPIFKYITSWLNRLWVSGIPGDPSILFYSEADQPDLFGTENQILCNQEDPITASAVYFDRLIVFNRHSMGQILGSTPDNFRYAAIPSSVGCVDNRTLQTHVLHGVPVLLWLSERGFYIYDGNAIDYISEPIENLVNFNIRQAIQQKNSNTQTTQAQFQAGTPSNGIDLVDVPGTITTKGYADGSSSVGTNPRRTWNDQSDWEGGSTNTNTVTKAGDNLLKVPLQFAPTLASGTRTNLNIVGSTLQLPFGGDQTVPQPSSDGNFLDIGGPSVTPPTGVGQQFVMQFNGTVPAITIYLGYLSTGVTSYTYRFRVYNDAGDTPGAVLFEESRTYNPASLPTGSTTSATFHPNLAAVAGQKYWWTYDNVSVNFNHLVPTNATISYAAQLPKAMRLVSGNWTTFEGAGSPNGTIDRGPNIGAYPKQLPCIIFFSKTAVPAAGNWVSGIYDTLSAYISTGLTITATGSYPVSFGATTASQMIIEGSDIATFAGGAQVTQTFNNINGTLSISLSGKRYWRIRITESTTDDRTSPSVGTPLLKFNTTSVWESDTVDTTSDSTVYNSLTLVSSAPAGTSITMKIATSASAGGPWTYVTFGTHTVRRYVRVQLTLVGNNTATPTATSINFTWTIVANLVSSVIDTAVVPPAGWDVFLSQFETNGGTVSFQMSSAPSIPQLGDGGHPFTTITSGAFPTNVAYQYVQWKVFITSMDGTVPTVEFVTVQWFISSVVSIRPASIFVDGRYYVALAELNQTNNNLVLELDLKGKWRRLSGLSIATFSFFFNRPYFGISSAGQIRKFLEGFDDAGTPIELDIRTKAFDYSTPYKDVSEKLKVVGEMIVHAKNTGATLQFMYSVDEGRNWFPLYTLNGATSYTTTTDGSDFFIRVKPSWSNGNPIAGQHLMYRIYNNDLFQVNIHTIKTQAMVRKGPPVVTG